MITVLGRRSRYFMSSPGQFQVLSYSPESGIAPVEGNWALAVISSGSGAASTVKPLAPPGWVVIQPLYTPGSGTYSVYLAAKLLTAADLAGDYWSYNTPNASEVNGFSITLIWGSGAAAPSTWVVGPSWQRNGSSTLTTRSPSITTTVANSTVVAFGADRTIAAETDEQVTTTPWNELMYVQNGDQAWQFAAKDFSTVGTATEEVVMTWPNSHAQNGFGRQIEIPPAAVVAAPKSGLVIRVITPTGYDERRLKVMWNGALTTPGAVRKVRSGYTSVSDMLAQPQFSVAHRGGSRDYPEMSKYAYGQSVLNQYGALELSLARTSDGVWFGLHDDSIDRTSGVTTGKLASQMTWAEVQQYQILGSVAAGNTTQPNRPYMRWEELMDLYYRSHVIFIDPKAAMSFRTELYGKMDAMPGTPTDRFVGKYYGVLGGNPLQADSFPAQLQARGYHRWGYFYQADVASFAAYQGRWSILGMDYNADQATWDAIKSYGKPVMGHITPTIAAYNTAIAKGANGMMVSGTKAILPPNT